jgi:hypothetical protein
VSQAFQQCKEQIKSLKNTLESQRTAFSEMSVKQQQEIDSLRKAANPLIAPIVSASEDIEILYAIDLSSPPEALRRLEVRK